MSIRFGGLKRIHSAQLLTNGRVGTSIKQHPSYFQMTIKRSFYNGHRSNLWILKIGVDALIKIIAHQHSIALLTSLNEAFPVAGVEMF